MRRKRRNHSSEFKAKVALEEAIQHYGTLEIFNTDQGTQFTSEEFTDLLKKHDIKISMDGKGRWLDNVFIERVSSPGGFHPKAMHLVQGGVYLDIVRDFLGHADIKTTELYARANLEMRGAAIEKVSPAPAPDIPSWKENKSLLQWLQRLQRL